jgi:hypothetical protein
VIANVSQGLIQLLGNLVEAVTFEKMQAQSITLVFGQGVEKSLDGRIADQLTEENVVSLFPEREAGKSATPSRSSRV